MPELLYLGLKYQNPPPLQKSIPLYDSLNYYREFYHMQGVDVKHVL